VTEKFDEEFSQILTDNRSSVPEIEASLQVGSQTFCDELRRIANEPEFRAIFNYSDYIFKYKEETLNPPKPRVLNRFDILDIPDDPAVTKEEKFDLIEAAEKYYSKVKKDLDNGWRY